MGSLARTNKYLVTRSGRVVGSRVVPAVTLLGPLLGGLLLGAAGVAAGVALDMPAVSVLAALIGLALFASGTIAAWVFLLDGGKGVARAAELWLAGDTPGVELCQRPLARVFRADVRMRAFHTLGLIAEANGDFAEAEDLFRRAYDAVPAMAAQRWKRHAQCLMMAHSAIALVAIGRLDEADQRARAASALYPPVAGGGLLDALGDDTAFGALGIAAALRDLEPGRDPRALVALSSAVVLAARGNARDALELVNRERFCLDAGLLPREKALLANVEARSRGLLPGGAMRSPGQASPSPDRWAQRVLPGQA